MYANLKATFLLASLKLVILNNKLLIKKQLVDWSGKIWGDNIFCEYCKTCVKCRNLYPSYGELFIG